MTIQTQRVAGSRSGDGDWARSWFADHGFSYVPVDLYGPATLALSVSAEFEAWCETEGVPQSRQLEARRAADQQVRAASGPGGPLRLAARDVAAWAILRRGPRGCP